MQETKKPRWESVPTGLTGANQPYAIHRMELKPGLRLEAVQSVFRSETTDRAYDFRLLRSEDNMQEYVAHTEKIPCDDDEAAKAAAVKWLSGWARDLDRKTHELTDPIKTALVCSEAPELPNGCRFAVVPSENLAIRLPDGRIESEIYMSTTIMALRIGQAVRTHATALALVPDEYLTTKDCEHGEIRLDEKNPEAAPFLLKLAQDLERARDLFEATRGGIE